MLHAVIMAGGSGTRFWPQSRRNLPKQLLRLAGDVTMLQATVARIAPLAPGDRTLIVTNARLADETRRQIPSVPVGNILCEPCGRNTAPCIGWAALRLLQVDPDATMIVMPADHVIQPAEAFTAAVTQATEIVRADPSALVLFGVPPTYPATGYGYIERAEPRSCASETDSPAFRVAAFREKPRVEVARQYLDSGRFYWNCGIFVWSARRIVELLRQYEPESIERLERIVQAENSAPGGDAADATLQAEFPQVKSISIDYAVLEKAAQETAEQKTGGNVFVLPATFAWDDVGSWRSLERLIPADADGNTVDGPFVGVRSRGCIVRTTGDHLVTALGVENLVIVHTPDATLVANKNDEDAIRQLVDELERRGFTDHL